MNTRPDGWDGLLDPDEDIIWQGCHDPAFRFDLSKPAELGVGLFFMGFSTFWMLTSARLGGSVWLVGLLFFSVGFYGAIGTHFWKTYQRRNAQYTLTNTRAFIGKKNLLARTLNSYPIRKDTPLTFSENGHLGTIHFAEKLTAHKRGSLRSPHGTTLTPIGFEYIENPRDVLALKRQVQSTAA